jgi:hypothetical protein
MVIAEKCARAACRSKKAPALPGAFLIEGVHPPFTTKFSVFAAAVLLGVVNYDH